MALAAAVVSGCGGPPARAASEVEIKVHFSGFEAGPATVPAGVPVTFVLRNEDPIEHEWIIGTESVHERHRTGTEPSHDEVPTEVTLPAFSTRETTVTLDEPGEWQFFCHLPGHEAYGMKGTVRVVAR